MIKKIDEGYYVSESIKFVDWHAGHKNEGSIQRFIIFINNILFLSTSRRDKEKLHLSDIPLVTKSGTYKIEGSKILFNYFPSGYSEEASIISSELLEHNFSNPPNIMHFVKWESLHY